ncbi:cytochrome P450 [Trujillonella endophytica]|uniref:Cytochrome P450 n=1 Tax=Trujillonella endophytica TaxID=673521 RepID=A0A1H8QTQ2_9ACTN|nr:cytochrome P450 [Trujillella endophytica]SEO57600.1 Cytochrome P450 [Trujillella endophytica]
MSLEIAPDADGRLVCPFDHHSPEYAQQNREMFKDLRDAGPVVWSEAYGGFWVATDYVHIREVLNDSETFTVETIDGAREGGTLLPAPRGAAFLKPDTTLFNFFDGERHDRVRAALNPHFSRRRVAQLAPLIEATVSRVLDRVVEQREFDIVYDLAAPITAGIVNEHMGFGLEDPAPFFRAVFSLKRAEEVADPASKDPVVTTYKEGWAYLGEVARARREEPRDDVISALVQADDGAFTDEDIQGMCMNVIFGAADTTAAFTAHSLTFLAERPDLQAELRADPKKIPAFIREGLRYFNVAMGVARTATRDVELGGMQIRRGDRVFALQPSGNLDPALYEEPEAFDMARPAQQHLGFGGGIHSCLGASLAQAIVAADIRGVLERVEAYSIDPGKLVRNSDLSFISLFEEAPMRVDVVADRQATVP